MEFFRLHLTTLLMALLSCTPSSIYGVVLLSPSPSGGASLIFSPQLTPGIIAAPQLHPENVAHPAVVENALAESRLPQELLNPFYKNPAIAAGLAKESWFTNKEFPIQHREAERISRSEIFKRIRELSRRR